MADGELVMSPDQIWEGDVFGRRAEADQLAAYIESVLGRPPLREDKRAFTIAVDGGYGIGKTFFLRRFAKHLAINHPVAFVDAWADDLADEPLTALAATLKEALKPFEHEQKVASKIGAFMSKAGRVTAIAAKGLARRGIGLAITGGALESIDGVLDGTTDALTDAVAEGVKDAVDGTIDDTAAAIRDVTSHDLMQKRVAEFEEGRAAVQAMKDSLRAIVHALDESELHPPIVIVIDELDRCRPTYAIKLLEEIKHLFDVPGLVFLLGIHSDQLARSVSGAYGSEFDGRAYLRRFLDREYRLALPDLRPLLGRLCPLAGIGEDSFSFPPVDDPSRGKGRLDVASMLGEYLRYYDLAARDAFQLIDILQTALAVGQFKPLQGALLVPLAVGRLMGLPAGSLPEPVRPKDGMFIFRHPSDPREIVLKSFSEYAHELQAASQMTENELNQVFATNKNTPAIDAIATMRQFGAHTLPLSDPRRYPDLLTIVGRFANPAFG